MGGDIGGRSGKRGMSCEKSTQTGGKKVAREILNSTA